MPDADPSEHTVIDAPVVDFHEIDPVHGLFSLSYSNYLVLHRTRLQSMPDDWQARFVALVREMDAAYRDLPAAEAYNVEAGAWQCPEDLSDDQRRILKITSSREAALAEISDDLDEDERYKREEAIYDEEERFYDATGNELDTGHECVFVPGPEPTPHYNRGRARVTPDLDAIQAHRRFVATELHKKARRRALVSTRRGEDRPPTTR